jgi:Na+/H+-dicarboxylate symporter
MKLWMRFVLGCVIGVVLGLSLPEQGGDTARLFDRISAIFLNIGRYALFPLVFFNVVTAVAQLREDGKLYSTVSRTVSVLVVGTVVCVVVGTLAVLLLTPQRIPLFIQEGDTITLPTLAETLTETFPRNAFRVFVDVGNSLLPVVVLAILLGVVASGDDRSAGPFLDFVDSTGRVMYRLNAVVMEGVAVGLIALTVSRVFVLRGITDFELFGQLVLIIAAIAGILGVIVLPLLYYMLTAKRGNPFHWLYAMIPAAIAAVFSGDNYFASAAVFRVARSNLGVSRPVEAPVVSILAVFGRAGSAMVIGGSFVLIVQSYTALEIGVSQVLWILGAAMVVSLFLGSVPGAGVLAGLSWLSDMYQQGMEEVYLILQPIIPILISAGVFLDIMLSGFTASVVADAERERNALPVRDFV